MNIATPISASAIHADEWALRVDLAAAFRLAAGFDWHESVGNHFSVALSADGGRFLMNPRWKHFSTIRASDLLLLDAGDAETMRRPNAPDASAWCIHGTIHARMPAARVLLHCHPPYATALASLKDPAMKPVDQNTARFFGLVGVDLGFSGLADEAEEGIRLAEAFGTHQVLLMGNHGVTVTAATVAEAFEHLYFFERASKTLMLAYASGQELNVMSDAVAAKTAEGWRAYNDMAFAHFEQLKAMLDRQDPSYRD
ncbi:class II aldolase/adducin family protein [Labrys monachus]|uniref:Ribulose-5-phosphate 4-epimerase/fuculose-1-phosphate aldolase n=1 Tax=Labrys monachus TaxID=217067 RepID=A0ABU0FNU1_9HYPH|nr:class II aldolase/adducin family protein [Labrys monachus]MDQ0396032.1 ribulose-5-phosphate 4-epimerase/fuculose-1-phosphate aldolase [Labrys monachus]